MGQIKFLEKINILLYVQGIDLLSAQYKYFIFLNICRQEKFNLNDE